MNVGVFSLIVPKFEPRYSEMRHSAPITQEKFHIKSDIVFHCLQDDPFVNAVQLVDRQECAAC